MKLQMKSIARTKCYKIIKDDKLKWLKNAKRNKTKIEKMQQKYKKKWNYGQQGLNPSHGGWEAWASTTPPWPSTY